MAPRSDVTGKVVIQPDFSVVMIGQSPAAAAELAPFCERMTRTGGEAAMVLKITRASVIKAVSHGLQPAEIVERLERNASNKVPANVLREVRDWSHWVRRVTSTTLNVLRCADSETADRVMAVLKRRADRINATLVALDPKKLTAAERTKLQDHGIIVQTALEAWDRKVMELNEC
jgi:Helicase conserved C-terminal domain